MHIETLKSERLDVPGNFDLVSLANDIRDHGLDVPVLVTEDGYIIDGVRRVRALNGHLRRTTVEVEVVTNLSVALENLGEAHAEGRVPPPRRVYELCLALDPFIAQRLAARRRATNGKHSKGIRNAERFVGGRELLAYALNLTNRQVVDTIFRAYRDSIAAGRLDLVRGLDEGAITPSTALYQLGGNHAQRAAANAEMFRNGPPLSEREFREATRRIDAVTKALEVLPTETLTDPDVRTELEKQLARARRRITIMINDLRKGTTK